MNGAVRRHALEKLAYFGSAPVNGVPVYLTPPPTVGQVMYLANSPMSPLPPASGRFLTDRIVNTGINVNAPAKSLIRAGLGALAGNFISNALGAGPFGRGLATGIGATYGYNH